MLEINNHIQIPEVEFSWSFVRAGGPGGQNVNKVASRAVLRWAVAARPSLPDDVKARFQAQQHGRITNEGELMLSSQRFRDQERNRQDCLDKLREMVLEATYVPKKRRPSKPTRASKARRVADKRRRSATKAARRKPADD
jgi:ribosome-associated protein